MTYKEAREYLIPVAANCVLPQYAAALEKAMEALEEVERYRATELEPEEIEQTLMNFSGFLCEMTGNRMSKTNYTLEAMVSVANDYAQTICAECPDRKELEELNIDRLRELAQADKEGRVVVLPCKVGDTVYWLDYNREACHDCREYSSFYGMDSMCDKHYELYPEINGVDDEEHCPKHFIEIFEFPATQTWIFNHRADFGKTVFLTREEAEAALKGEYHG